MKSIFFIKVMLNRQNNLCNYVKIEIEVKAMHKNNDELNNILDELLLNSENECVEFKRAENNFDIDTLGKYLISA